MCATLVSPGVSVTVTDESQYATSGQGTIPLIILATQTNKSSPTAGAGIAPYTVPAQANQLYLATSQRDLIQNFGNPWFNVVQGTPVHGYELNEYGLWAAYSYLGIASECYVLRADLDLAGLTPTATAPSSPSLPGTYWLNTSSTAWGIFRANGNAAPGLAWTAVVPLVAISANVGHLPSSIPSTDPLNPEQSADTGETNWPLSSFGVNGDVCVVPTTTSNYIYENILGQWYRIGSDDWLANHPTIVTGTVTFPTIVSGTTVIINGSTVTITAGHLNIVMTDVVNDINAAAISDITASIAANGALTITNTAGGSIVLGTGTANAALGLSAATTVNGGARSVTYSNSAAYPSGSVAGSFWIKGAPANNGAAWSVNYYSSAVSNFTTVPAPFYPFNSIAADGTVTTPDAAKDAAALAAATTLWPVVGSVYVGYDAITGDQQLRRWTGSQWQSLVYQAKSSAPTLPPVAGTLWYNTNFVADIMYGNGENWLGYRHHFPATDINGPQIAGSAPTMQSNGTSQLVQNDLWIDSSNLENYPAIYTYDVPTQTWNLIDNTNSTVPWLGITFADARQDSGTPFQIDGVSNQNQTGYNFISTAAADLALSDFVDPDAPDARTFPAGMLLFNTRFSTYNVKSYQPMYFRAGGGFSATTDYTQTGYQWGDTNAMVFYALPNPARWVTASGKQTSGAPYMGRKAQRIMVVTALQATVIANQAIRSEVVFFNLIAAPGYPELIPDLNLLNTDMKDVAFVVGDTPIRLPSDGTSQQNWATNAANASVTGEDGLLTSGDYIAVWYPWGLGTNLDGTEIMIPPSAIALVTIAYNDQVAYPWYAPAGFTRGLVSNATSVGYLNSNGEYVSTILNQGQRDVMYTNNINPIAYIPRRGLVVYGQKTLDPVTTALDRINVARLMNYIAYNLDLIVKPFLFEPNTTTTRANARIIVEKFFSQLVSLNGLYDYAVVCDTTNNTPTTIDANELWLDASVQPVKSVEFIYIPVRVLTTQISS